MSSIHMGDIITAKERYSSGSGTALQSSIEYEVVSEPIRHNGETYYVVKTDRTYNNGYIDDLYKANKTPHQAKDKYWAIKEHMIRFIRHGITGICIGCINICKIDKKTECSLKETN